MENEKNNSEVSPVDLLEALRLISVTIRRET